MVEKDVIQAKVATIRRCLMRIREKTELCPEKLIDLDVQDIFVLNLQRAIQACIDTAAHMISGNGWGLPSSLKDHFDILARHNVLEQELANQLKKMTGFHNIAVHDYQALELVVLQRILQNHLVNIEDFYEAILRCTESDGEAGKY
ncbi:type VII toxin-antitoxin system HepT family RNase toxin [Heliophilum fasciatum]|nr:DUF86 domain-containing protein [Heliophilum fasciatum]MCW2279131.1 uncharacterized protein YutE (UPF0331/DUF86 family) [Heliophilum fasciatum]